MKKRAIFIKTDEGKTILAIDKNDYKWTRKQLQNIYVSWGKIEKVIEFDNLSIAMML